MRPDPPRFWPGLNHVAAVPRVSRRQTGENKSILEMVKTCLNLTFALVALFKITMELGLS